MSTGPPLYRAADIAEKLGKSEDWVYDAARHRRIPHRRIGHSIRFTDADLEAIITAAGVPPADPPPPPKASRRTYPTYRRSA